MEFLRMLEKIRTPLLDKIMLGITSLGDETAFLIIALIIFWCISKRLGYYVLSVGFLGTIANQCLKLTARIPRPWILDSRFSIVEQARASATGYSFPSGHTQNAVGTFGAMACASNSKKVRAVCILLALLIPFSRMYLGVHTPWDVGAAALMALILVFSLRSLIYEDRNGRKTFWFLAAMVIVGIAFFSFAEFYPFPSGIDADNLLSGQKNACTLLGAVIGFNIAYWVDRKYLHFETKAVWWAQILKTAGGLILVLLVKISLKAPLTILLGQSAERIVRYFLVVLVAGVLWPMTFKWFSKLGSKNPL